MDSSNVQLVELLLQCGQVVSMDHIELCLLKVVAGAGQLQLILEPICSYLSSVLSQQSMRQVTLKLLQKALLETIKLGKLWSFDQLVGGACSRKFADADLSSRELFSGIRVLHVACFEMINQQAAAEHRNFIVKKLLSVEKKLLAVDEASAVVGELHQVRAKPSTMHWPLQIDIAVCA